MRAITTKYHGPTNTRGARISATCGYTGIRVYESYDDSLCQADAHAQAARKLICRLVAEDRIGNVPEFMLMGETQDAYIFTLCNEHCLYRTDGPTYPIPLNP